MTTYPECVQQQLHRTDLAAIVIVPTNNIEGHSLLAWMVQNTPARNIVSSHPDPDIRAEFMVRCAIAAHERCEPIEQ